MHLLCGPLALPRALVREGLPRRRLACVPALGLQACLPEPGLLLRPEQLPSMDTGSAPLHFYICSILLMEIGRERN